ncbi:putative hyalin-like isoform X2 [Apostichopus japonicus]|uniref:Putative hyalin-like isoform X2 n=1 Tax=Stichopus japonicus TaxID=307972 RepID=A0A2G8JKC8_STIJA|nr:putative hyalin-like isoform X2 [Apostichopus japonicus]
MEVILNSLSTYVRQLSFDFTGTRITASKVVSVSSGHECANYDSSCDHIIEVMPPVESWGRTFAMTSFTGRTQGYFVKIFTTHADTIVRMVLQHEVYEVPGNGTLYFDMPLSSAVVMECDHPVMVVAQVKTNPFMSVIPAIEQSIVGPIPFYSFSDDDNYLNLWASTNDFRGILIDDEQVSWEVVMSSDSWGSLVRGSLSAGHHVVRHTDVNVTLSGIIYGYDYESSYAHTLPYKPVNVKDTTAPYISICHTVPVEVIGNYDRNVTAVMWMEPSVIDEEGLPITVSTNYQPGDLFPIGSTTVMYSFSDYSGNRAFCSFDVIVHDITPPVPRCPGHLRVDSCSKKATISWPEPHVWDNSEGNVIITKDHEFGDELRGVEFIQYTFTDESGNVATCKIKVEVSKDDSLCWQLTMPFVISAVMLGLTLVPFLYTTGILVHHRRSTKSLVHRPGNENVGTTPPCQPPCGDDDIYEDPSQFQKGDGQKNDSGLTYEEPTTSPFGEDYVEAKRRQRGTTLG